jgi:hypothetical protein
MRRVPKEKLDLQVSLDLSKLNSARKKKEPSMP